MSYICNLTIICHRNCPPAVRLAEGLADDNRERSLAVPCDCPLKLKFVPVGNAEKVKSALCGLYVKLQKIFGALFLQCLFYLHANNSYFP